MQCNIDKKGRIARAIWGALCLFAGIAIGIMCLLGKLSPGFYWATGLLIPAGLFAIYEAKKSWCVVRAMGFKTPM